MLLNLPIFGEFPAKWAQLYAQIIEDSDKITRFLNHQTSLLSSPALRLSNETYFTIVSPLDHDFGSFFCEVLMYELQKTDFSYGHTCQNTPDPVRSPKLSW
jgi:hypothetical protein